MKKELGILLLALLAAVGLSGAVAAQPMGPGNMHMPTSVHPIYTHHIIHHHIIHHHMYMHHIVRHHMYMHHMYRAMR